MALMILGRQHYMPNSFVVETDIERLKRYESPNTDQIPVEKQKVIHGVPMKFPE
jgi:hypothetical protein